MKRRMVFLWSIMMGIATLLILFYQAGRAASPSQPECPSCNSFGVQRFQDRKEAPAFTLKCLDEKLINLSDFKGKPVLLTFWATWCIPCRAEMPELQRLHERLGPAGLVVMGVNQNEAPETIERYRQELGLDFPTLLDLRLGTSREYAVNSIPTTFFIDREGVIRNLFIGPMTDAVLADNLKTIYP